MNNNLNKNNNRFKKDYKILHLSDMHFDINYLEGSNANCGMASCCLLNNAEKEEDKVFYFIKGWQSFISL